MRRTCGGGGSRGDRDGYVNVGLDGHARGAGDEGGRGGVLHGHHCVHLTRRRIAQVDVQVAQVVEQVAEQVHHVVDVVGEALAPVVA